MYDLMPDRIKRGYDDIVSHIIAQNMLKPDAHKCVFQHPALNECSGLRGVTK